MLNKATILFYCLIFFLINGNAQETWSPVGSGYFGIPSGSTVQTFKVIDNKLYVGGGFSNTGTITAYGIAMWDGNDWYSFGSGTAYVYSIEEYNGDVYVGTNSTWNPLVQWNGSNWNGVGSKKPSSDVKAIRYKTDLYVGGLFNYLIDTNGSQTLARQMAKWDGSQWSTVGGGVGSSSLPNIRAFAEYNDELIVAGGFTCVGQPCNWTGYYNIARWDGTQWLKLDNGVSGDDVNTLEVDTVNNVLYVGGAIYGTAGPNPITLWMIGKWDGNKWEGLPGDSIFNNSIYSLKFYHGYLYAGLPNTSFQTNFVRYDGKQWEKLNNPSSSILAMEVYQDDLYVGGTFMHVNGDSSMRFLARFYTPDYCDSVWAQINTTQDTIKLAGGAPLQISASGYANQWEWDFADGTIDTAQNPTHVYDSGGVFTLKLRATFGFCPWAYDSVIVQAEGTGVEELRITNYKLRIYPNPAGNSFTVEIPENVKLKNARIEIVDMKGRLVKQLATDNRQLIIETKRWGKGVYFVNLVEGEKVRAREKVVVE